ncbi:MAG: hypothetical protein WAK71_11655 [Streptosporangiaceae bacterium]
MPSSENSRVKLHVTTPGAAVAGGHAERGVFWRTLTGLFLLPLAPSEGAARGLIGVALGAAETSG